MRLLFSKIGIACDHAGFELKGKVKSFLENQDLVVEDYGCYSSESSDYPDYAHPLAEGVSSGKHEIGISICGSGNGINMVVNKHQAIRSALCWNTEIAYMARSPNPAHLLALPARYINENLAIQMIKTFLETEFAGGRHQRRIEKIPLK